MSVVEKGYQPVRDDLQPAPSEIIQVAENRQKETVVKLWQLVLFVGCLTLLAISTVLVLIESLTGFISERMHRPSSDDSSSGREATDSSSGHHIWTDRDAFRCKVNDWRESEEWSNIKLDACCLVEKIGCHRLPQYRCQEEKSDLKSWSFDQRRWCCATADIGCENMVLALGALVRSPLCVGANCPSERQYACNVDVEQWWLAWSAGKMRWCCQQRGMDCSTPGRSPRIQALGDANRVRYGCHESCIIQSHMQTCDHWVVDMALHVFGHQTDPCSSAKKKVRIQCPQCSDCLYSHGSDCQKALNAYQMRKK